MVKKKSVFAENLFNTRKKAGYTQDSFAEALGISGQAIKDLESGRTKGKAPMLLKISQLLGVSIDYLMTDHLLPESERNKVHLTPVMAEDLGLDYQLLQKISDLQGKEMDFLVRTVDQLYELTQLRKNGKKASSGG